MQNLQTWSTSFPVFCEKIENINPRSAEELFWCIQVLKRDFTQAITYIHTFKDLLNNVAAIRSSNKIDKQLEQIHQVLNQTVSFEMVSILLYDQFINSFYKLVIFCFYYL